MPAPRAFLPGLADVAAGRAAASAPSIGDVDRLAAWVRGHRLAAPAHAWGRVHAPRLAAALHAEAAGAAASTLFRLEELRVVEERLREEAIGVVLLKGAAVASAAYADEAYRAMTDLDLWVREDEIDRAAAALRALGYRETAGVPGRPSALQRRSGGEIAFVAKGRRHAFVELHFSAFQGWWVRRAAAVDADAVWNRAVPAAPGRHARRLAVEDAILQTAFHAAVNQLGQAPLRGLLDLAVMARACAPDWARVAERASAWRLRTASWLVLSLADALFGLPGAQPALRALRPGRMRRALLAGFVDADALAAGRDLTRPARRHPFMLALVDRPADAARLVARALWPEPWWREARYGRPVGPARHLLAMLRRGEV